MKRKIILTFILITFLILYADTLKIIYDYTLHSHLQKNQLKSEIKKAKIISSNDKTIVKSNLNLRILEKDQINGEVIVEQLDTHNGLVFIHNLPDKYIYWTKNTKIPLDILWIYDDQIIQVTENVQPPLPHQPDDSIRLYIPRNKINRVIELNAGYFKENNLRIGDKVLID